MTPSADFDVLAELGLAAWVPAGEGRYRLIAKAPRWLEPFFFASGPPKSAIVLTDCFPFLEAFLPAAERFWASPAGRERLKSDLWTQKDDRGVERHLCATALVVGENRGLLVLESAEERFHETQALVQHAHDSSLAYDKIAKLSRELEHATQAKSEFLARMSHEIRTPMNALLGMATLLSETPLTPEQSEYVQIFRRAGDNLLSVVNDILDFSKVEAGQLDLEQIEFDLNDVLESAAEVIAVRAHAKGLELSYRIADDVPRRLIGDANRLRQILLNLLGNAAKFTDHGELAVRVNLENPHGTVLRFTIADTGIGIPADRLSTIFESFTQVESSTSRKYGGTGLGLAISQRLVELMGGRIWAESAPGAGTTMHFLASFGTAQTGPEPSLPPGEFRAMVIAPNQNHRAAVADLLRRLGVSIIASDIQPSPARTFVFIDEADGGFELADSLKRQHPSAAIVMMLTTDKLTEAARCRDRGFDSILKPVRRSDLIALLQGKPRVQESPVTPRISPLRILHVDDSLDNRILMRGYLKETGCQIEEAGNGAAALEKFQAHKFDVVLMDAEMPEMDGYTATRQMRAHENRTGSPPTPILLVTAHALPEARRRSLAAGCSDHLTKPLQKATLLAALSRYTGSVAAAIAPSEPEPWLKEIIPGYLQRLRGSIRTLLPALEHGDYVAIATVGHQLSGTGSSYGFPALTDMGASLEQAALKSDPGLIRDLAAKLTAYLSEIRP